MCAYGTMAIDFNPRPSYLSMSPTSRFNCGSSIKDSFGGVARLPHDLALKEMMQRKKEEGVCVHSHRRLKMDTSHRDYD